MEEKDLLEFASKVIEEEIKGLKKLLSSLDKNFLKAIEILKECKGKVILTGIGKSGHIARKISSTLSSTGTPSVFLHPAEALHGDMGLLDSKDTLIAISNSGESTEVLYVLQYAKALNIPVIGITGNERSSLAKYSDVVLKIPVDKEACPFNLAPTVSSTVTLALGDAIAITLMRLRGFSQEDFAKRHPAGALGRKLKLVKDLYHTGEEVPIVKEDTPMKEAIIEMTTKGFGATAVVDEEGKLVGIITDGDLRRFVNRGGSFENTRAKDVMTRNPKTIKPDELALKALRKMEDHNITVLIVVNEERKPIGIIHMHDILKAELS